MKLSDDLLTGGVILCQGLNCLFGELQISLQIFEVIFALD